MKDSEFLAQQVTDAEEKRLLGREVIGMCELCGLIDHHIQKGVGGCCRDKLKDGENE